MNKISAGSSTMFRKGIAVNNKTAKVADILSKVSKLGDTILNNNSVKDLAGRTREGQKAYEIAQGGNQLIGLGGHVISHLTNEGSYQPDHHGQNNAIERAKQETKVSRTLPSYYT